ncbi:angiopoietin-related protein 1-like [Mizuhopecten yessoensis]|uniref:angiopoietin-related protein 1-like n=1 Tax=Mizuhopecten yessoensis TaxID=6573 RepID=UPI000B45DD1F|nr:angiopoietin-related protein 1-like [Mizuhopecten yessoensis]
MLVLLIFSVMFVCSVDAITIRNRTFAIHTEFSDIMYGDGLITNYTLTSLTLCGVYCGVQNCLSFSYSNKTGICRTYSTSFPLCEPTPSANQNSGSSLPFYRELDYQQQFCPCNWDLNDGTWTVIHQRFDGSVDFERDWSSYRNGFGNNPSGEFWIGLEKIYQLVNGKEYVLMVDLVDKMDIRKCSYFGTFNISSEADNYRLRVDGYVGTGGDSLSFHNGMQFSTTDRDNDVRSLGSCVAAFNGPGWLNDCLSQNLNGLYNVLTGANSMCWRAFRNFDGLKKAKMLIKEKGT